MKKIEECKEQKKHKKEKIFLKNDVIRDTSLSDYGLVMYCYFRAIQKLDSDYCTISLRLVNYFFRDTFELSSKERNQYISGLKDLEEHKLITRIQEGKDCYEYDISKLAFKTNVSKGNVTEYFTIIFNTEMKNIMQIPTDVTTVNKAKLLRYYIAVVSTFTNEECYRVTTEEGDKISVLGYCSIETLATYANINKDTVIAYNKILEQMRILFIYRSTKLKLMKNGITGITNTYGRYEYYNLVARVAYDHEQEVGEASSVRKSEAVRKRQSLGIKYRNWQKGKEYDKDTIKQLFDYAVNYNINYICQHRNDDSHTFDLKDLKGFTKYYFLDVKSAKRRIDKAKKMFLRNNQ